MLLRDLAIAVSWRRTLQPPRRAAFGVDVTITRCDPGHKQWHSAVPESLRSRGFVAGRNGRRQRRGDLRHACGDGPDGAARRYALSTSGSPTGTVNSVTDDQLGAWVAALDEVIDELHDDLVRRSIVHLQTLRAEVQRVVGLSD